MKLKLVKITEDIWQTEISDLGVFIHHLEGWEVLFLWS